ncbi:Protein UNC-8 [Aphelenchoides avenae]|nr:Protein UNC-8 [Aphelenchus avenae]
MRYRTIVHTRWNFEPAPFPAVTVCNLNGYKVSALKNTDAIEVGQVRENVSVTLAALPRERRQKLSYALEDLVLRCSFNGLDCDLERDFKLHMDAEYGNCYTFNFNDSVLLKNDRVGPAHGLRLLLNVDQADYMPTTESAGVRVVVHEQDQEPFPDTFGYNAPAEV